MTATETFDSTLARAHGLDRIVMKLSLTMLRWAEARSERATAHPLDRDDLARARAQLEAIERREHESALRAARVI